jgi:hypothetical protein
MRVAKIARPSGSVTSAWTGSEASVHQSVRLSQPPRSFVKQARRPAPASSRSRVATQSAAMAR